MIEKQMKDLAWSTFKKTGDINTFMEFKKVEIIEKGSWQNQTKSIYKNELQH